MKYAVLILPMLLGACTSNWDMQGQDPKDFYKEHPVENKVETKYETYAVHFIPGVDRLTADDIDSLRSSLRNISPMATESVQIQVSPGDIHNAARQQHLTKLLRSFGYPEKTIMFEPSDTLGKNDMQLNIAYASVVSPHCPDWRTSPVTTYSNTNQGNLGCSSVTNLGLMVADPRDLEKGSGNVTPDSGRSLSVIQGYHSGAGATAASSSSSSSSGSSSGSSASGTSGQ